MKWREFSYLIVSRYVCAEFTCVFFGLALNMQAIDVESIAVLVGVDQNRVWNELTAIWAKVDGRFPGNTSLKKIFEDLPTLEYGAHHRDPNIPLPNLLTISRNIKLICLCVDALISYGLCLVSQGMPKSGTQASAIKIRSIRQNGTQWPEYSPGRKKAAKRHSSLADAILAATNRARGTGELVLALDNTADVIDWRAPSL